MIASRFAPRETFEIVSLWYQSGGHEHGLQKRILSLRCDETFASCSLSAAHRDSRIRTSWYRNMVPSADAFSTWDYEGDIYAQTPRTLQNTHVQMSRYLHIDFTYKYKYMNNHAYVCYIRQNISGFNRVSLRFHLSGTIAINKEYRVGPK